MTVVINLYGEPSSGKSTIASGLFFHMKMGGLNVEMAPEYIKSKVFEENPYPFKDQLYVFAKQNKKLRELQGKVDFIITDSPLLMSLVYNSTEPPLFDEMVLQYYKQYNNMNFALFQKGAAPRADCRFQSSKTENVFIPPRRSTP